MYPKKLLTLVAAGSAATLLLTACSSSSGSSPGDAIQIGQSIGISGVAGAYGKGKLDGQLAMIEAINADGGIDGREIELNYLDDGFDPSRSVQNVRKLIEEGNVALLAGSGSASIESVVPLLAQRQIPLLFPAKTNIEWVDGPDPQVFSIIPTFRDQTAAMIEHAFETNGPGSVFLVATQSADVDHIIDGAQETVEASGGTWLGSNLVPFGATDVTPFALQAAKGSPDYIVFESAPAETTKIVTALAESGDLPAKNILGLTSMPGTTFLDGVPAQAADISMSFSATVPPSDEGAKECVDALREAGIEKPDLVNLAGCNEVRLLASVLEDIDGDVTSESITDRLNAVAGEELSPLVPDVTYSPDNHMGLTELPVVVIRDGSFVVDGTAPVPVLSE